MISDAQWQELRNAVDEVCNRETDFVELPEEPGINRERGKTADGSPGQVRPQNPIRVARGYCSGPLTRTGITVIIEPTVGWDLEPEPAE